MLLSVTLVTEEEEPDMVGHFPFMLREVVIRPHSGIPLVEGGLSITVVNLGLWRKFSHIHIRILICGSLEAGMTLFKKGT